jgi:hypothetical protein
MRVTANTQRARKRKRERENTGKDTDTATDTLAHTCGSTSGALMVVMLRTSIPKIDANRRPIKNPHKSVP